LTTSDHYEYLKAEEERENRTRKGKLESLRNGQVSTISGTEGESASGATLGLSPLHP
jgi:hypothetical protein